MTKRLKNYVIESNQIELKKKLNDTIKKSTSISLWIEENIERNEKRVILSNLLSSTIDYLEVAKTSLNSHISILALSTRSIYEVNVRLRTLIENSAELEKWQSEAVTDKVQILEGILLLTNPSENATEQNISKQEIERLQRLINKYDLPTVKSPASTGNLVKTVGLEGEHKTLFKLYSKLIHPSSFLVNDYSNAASIENKKILQIHGQIYAHDTISRICNEFSVPYEVSKPYGQA